MQRLFSISLVALTLLAAGCGGKSEGSEQASPTGPVVRTIQISETEFRLSPASVKVEKPGTYLFHVVNDGSVTHALEVEGHDVETETEDISPGGTADLRVDLSKPGSYEVYCPIDGHEDRGMKASLTVGTRGAGGPNTDETDGGGVTRY